MMKNRRRNERLEIKLTEKEMQIFRDKMTMSGSKTMTDFLIRCVLEKEIFVVDMQLFREIQQLLSNEANNINQVAKHTNIVGEVSKNDIKNILNSNLKQSKEILKLQQIIYKKAHHKEVN